MKKELEEQNNRAEQLREYRKSLTKVDVFLICQDEMIGLMDQPPFSKILNSINSIYNSYVFDNKISFEEACEKSKPLFLEFDNTYFKYKKLLHNVEE